MRSVQIKRDTERKEGERETGEQMEAKTQLTAHCEGRGRERRARTSKQPTS